MYLIIQTKWIRGSTQNGEFIIDQSTRIKEARGLVKHHFKSHLTMLLKHPPVDWTDYEIDELRHWVALADNESIAYISGFYIKEVADA